MTDFLVESAKVWSRPHRGDLTQAYVFCTVLSANLSHVGYRGTLAAQASTGHDNGQVCRRPISVNAVATSLALPYETVRRKAAALVATGMVRRDRMGLVVVPDTMARPELVAAAAQIRCLLSLLVGRLRQIGLDPSAISVTQDNDAAEPPDAVIARIVMDAQIRSLEQIASIFGDLISAYVFCGTLRANEQPLLVSPQLAWRFSSWGDLPPDAVRRPIAVRELARQLEMPFETVRRQIQRLRASGSVMSAGAEGFIVPASAMDNENTEYQRGKLSLEFFRMLSALHSVGAFRRDLEEAAVGA